MDLSFLCKFSDKGCKEIGARSPMQNHIRYCTFEKIKCPAYLCNEMIPHGEMVDHLKIRHKSWECRTEASGEIQDIFWNITIPSMGHIIAKVDGNFFLLNGIITKDLSIILWVTIVGTEEVAKRYEVKITAAPFGNTSAKTRGKVYSIDTSTKDILKDPRGTLDISKNMAKKMAEMKDGTPRICQHYHIIRK